MPTIVLQHVTLNYAGLSRPAGLLAFAGSLFAGGMRAVFRRERPSLETSHPLDPPDRPYALDDLSLVIRNGETLSILGPSGCGKTTLLKLIAGLLKPASGEVLYDSTPIGDIPPAARGIGMVFQNYALYPHMPARDNIGFYDLVHRHPERIPERIRQIVKVMGVELEYLLSRKPPTLSGGEQQRVAIARCLARDPKIFLFDEPLSNLDAKLRSETRLQLKRLLNHYQITAIYVTHDQVEAVALADRIAIMRAGKIEQIGTFQTLYDTPLNVFVAQFFGTPPMNLFLGHAQNTTWQGRGFSVTPIRPALQPGQSLWLGIRPEHIKLAPTGIPALVDLVEPLHAQRRQLVYTQIAGQRCIVSTDLGPEITPGSTIFLQFPTEHLYLFDQRTGTRIG